jgi:hypothetical protein
VDSFFDFKVCLLNKESKLLKIARIYVAKQSTNTIPNTTQSINFIKLDARKPMNEPTAAFKARL